MIIHENHRGQKDQRDDQGDHTGHQHHLLFPDQTKQQCRHKSAKHSRYRNIQGIFRPAGEGREKAFKQHRQPVADDEIRKQQKDAEKKGVHEIQALQISVPGEQEHLLP